VTIDEQQRWRAWCEQMLATDLSRQRHWYLKKDMTVAKAMLDLLNMVKERGRDGDDPTEKASAGPDCRG
jgi:hypothetical protein